MIHRRQQVESIINIYTQFFSYFTIVSQSLVASEGILYQYIVGIDREDVLLLCDPMDSMYNLSSLSWHVNGDTFSNPFIIFSARNSLPVFSTEINCISNSATILTSISIYG